MKNLGILISLLLITISGKSQTFIPGQVYYGTDSFTEYRAGNLPIILSAPHGGYLTPASLPDRVCAGCVTGRDSYTQELTRQIEASLLFKTGCYPHVIINRLHRKKLDANREIIEATDSNTVTETYWHDYMNFVDSAKDLLYEQYPKGIFFDIHGHGHTIQRIELGYLLKGSELRQNDSALNTTPLNSKTSILNLKFSNLNSYSHAELIRGTHSFGSMLERKGYPTVPSDSIPHPLSGEPYFNGGYNTVKFGSRNGGTIDAIQIESHQSVRFTSNARTLYADSLAEAMLEYIEKHYFMNFSNGYCNYLSSIPKTETYDLTIYPNPTSGKLFFNGLNKNSNYQLITIQGKIIQSGEIEANSSIDLSLIPNGIYFIKLIDEENLLVKKIIKK